MFTDAFFTVYLADAINIFFKCLHYFQSYDHHCTKCMFFQMAEDLGILTSQRTHINNIKGSGTC